MNSYEMLAREKKVSALVEALETEILSVIDSLDMECWESLAAKANVIPPSAETIRQVKERLAARRKVSVEYGPRELAEGGK